jgi:DNA-binding NarL/FixJ family response regulator
MKTTVLIADDHKLIRSAWGAVISADPGFSVIAECSSGNEAVELAILHKPDIILMDINMPDMDGIEATKQIHKKIPVSRIIGVSSHVHPSYARKIIKEGAVGYVTKTSSKEELFTAMQEALKNKRYLCEETKNIITEQAFDEEKKGGINALSQRELGIIHLIRQGFSSKEIADKIGISAKTVEVHRYNILRKLKLKNSAALVNYVHNHFIN